MVEGYSAYMFLACPSVGRENSKRYVCMIWIPGGAHISYLFRPIEEGRRKLVGEMHVYRIMNDRPSKQSS